MTEENIFNNASKIIEYFGGIRPMSHKINVPVTTIQGWKRRNTIPKNRIQDIPCGTSSRVFVLSDFVPADMEGDVKCEASYKQ